MNPTESEVLKTDQQSMEIGGSDSEDTVRGPMTKATGKSKLSAQSPTGKSSTSSWSEMKDMSENIHSKRGA